MQRVTRWAWAAFLLSACLAYQYLVHSSVSSAQAGPLHRVLMWLPLAALALWSMLHPRNRAFWLAALSAVGVLIYVLDQREQMGLVASSGLSHAAVYLFLLWYFGSTLAQGREPIITRLARRVHGPLDPVMERFAHRLTIAWCIFFAAQLVTSVLLYAFAPLSVWSIFVNVLNFPLVALMFVGQVLYRNLRCPDCPRASILQAAEAFRNKDASLSKGAEAR